MPKRNLAKECKKFFYYLIKKKQKTSIDPFPDVPIRRRPTSEEEYQIYLFRKYAGGPISYI